MDLKITKVPGAKVLIEIQLNSEELSPYFFKGAKALSSKIEIAGFRKGQAPPKVVKEWVGEEAIFKKAADIAIMEIFLKTVQEKNLKVIDQPKAYIQKLSKEGLEASVEAIIFPETKLPNWKEIARSVEKREIKVTPKEVENVLREFQESRAKIIRKLAPAQEGDEVLIDGEIRYRKVKIENGDIKNQRIILGKGRMIPGFAENLKGLKENEGKSFSLRVPLDFWQKKWRGKIFDVEVKVKGVFKRDLPQINDQFARSIGSFKDLFDMERSIKEGIEIEKRAEERARWRQEVISKIAKLTEGEIPEILIERERDQMLEELKKKVEESGLSFEDYLFHLKRSLLELKESLLNQAKARLKEEICLIEIAKNEGIEVKEEEVGEKINQVLKNYPSKAGAQEKLDLERLKIYFQENIFFEKIMERIEQSAKE